MTVNQAVALRIRELLKDRNMTQYKLEQNSGILHGTMSCILSERNKTVTLTTIILISKGFGINFHQFLDSTLFDEDNLNVE